VTERAREQPDRGFSLRGRWLLLARMAWVVVAVLYLGVFISGIPSEFVRLHTPLHRHHLVQLYPTPHR
jgi:hypothetical protein